MVAAGVTIEPLPKSIFLFGNIGKTTLYKLFLHKSHTAFCVGFMPAATINPK